MTETIKEISTAKLKKPGDWKKILASKRARDMAESVRRYGVLEPVVLNNDKSIVMGRHRAAACEILGIDVPAVSRVYGELEAKARTLVENLHRQHMTKDEEREAIKELVAVELEFQELAEEVNEGDELSWTKPSKPKASKKDAVEKVAKQTGKSPRTVEKALWPGRQEPTLPKDFDTFDLTCSPPEIKRICALHEAGLTALRAARDAKAAVGAIVIAGGNAAFVQTVERDLTGVIAMLAGDLPCSLCPFCKMTEKHMAKCHMCSGTGVVGKTKMTAIPKELKLRGEKALVQNKGGKYVAI